MAVYGDLHDRSTRGCNYLRKMGRRIETIQRAGK